MPCNQVRVLTAIVLIALLLPPAARGFAGGVTVIGVTGTALVKTEAGEERALLKGEVVPSGAKVRTKAGSSLVFRSGPDYRKLGAVSAVRVNGEPELIYGKMTKSADALMESVSYYVSSQPAQGKTASVVVRSDERIVGVRASIDDSRGGATEVRFHPLADGGYRALFGFDVEAGARKYALKISVVGESGDVTEVVHPFYLKKSSFEWGKVYLPASSRALLEPSEEKTEEREALFSLLSTPSGAQLWNYTFRYPVDTPAVISKFGRIRRYSIPGSPSFTRFHRGVDLEGNTGDPVLAPNSGVVVFAGMRITTGFTVVIDHGQGVFSLLFHMSTVLVDAGSYVIKGQRVGEVGATGITEGSHLHWGVFLNGVYVDPSEWVARAF
jgi:murein DD-endopeptidase MepM/ murein hydrolase activator NlpD